MEKRDIRPNISKVLIAYSIAHILAFVAIFGFLLLLPFPWSVVFPLILLFAVIDVAVFAYRAFWAFWIYLTQYYTVDEGNGYVKIYRGWVLKTSENIPFINITEVRALRPLLLRLFGLGHVAIGTNDGIIRFFYNVKNPQQIIETITIPVQTKQTAG